MMSNINIKGQGESMTTIDAQQTGQVFLIKRCRNNILSDFTVSGGTGSYGGGVR